QKEAVPSNDCPIGTHITLFQPVEVSMTIDYLLFKSALSSICREIKEVAVYLNGEKLTQETPHYLKLSKNYQNALGERSSVVLKIVFGAEGGVYRNHLKIQEVNAKYLERIPQKILDLMKEERLSFKIFLTQNRQIINRAGFAQQDKLDKFLQQ